ncbi:hypothetical protein RhiirA5_374569 [Rhizophagus irregularis]|uniref:Uncharacterized protein n=1 Tax=Rhizophagus irregularis TaxID=588596 RepID=A0A2N0PUP0_9GLOM|nr:hypothetical protein RhiirA5_374569 [Rhizophagus irregularis]
MIKRFGPPFIERRSRFFGISALRSWFFLQQLRRFGNSVPHFGSKVPVLSSATSALWHFGFTHRDYGTLIEKFISWVRMLSHQYRILIKSEKQYFIYFSFMVIGLNQFHQKHQILQLLKEKQVTQLHLYIILIKLDLTMFIARERVNKKSSIWEYDVFG